ncbi:UNVERIFIED_CONTAM: hypothetical protein K2H54_022868 [Gekko kuhli]
MLLSSLEVAMQTMGSFVSDYLEEEKGVPVITTDGLNQLVKEQFPHCEKKEISPTVYEIRIPLASSPTKEGNTFCRMELNIIIQMTKPEQPTGIPGTPEEVLKNTEELGRDDSMAQVTGSVIISNLKNQKSNPEKAYCQITKNGEIPGTFDRDLQNWTSGLVDEGEWDKAIAS